MPLESILCVRTDEIVPHLHGKTGFIPMSAPAIRQLLNPCNAWFIPRVKDKTGTQPFPPLMRGGIEHDESFLQLLPYVVLMDEGGRTPTIGMYARDGGGEARLDGKFSIGFGGHVQPRDAGPQYAGDATNIYKTVLNGAAREVDEEVSLAGGYFRQDFPAFASPIGLIYDTSDAVGRVHLGVAFVMSVALSPSARIKSGEGQSLGLTWMAPDDIMAYDVHARLENWSKLLAAHFATW